MEETENQLFIIPTATLIGSGLKPKIKVEYIQVLEPEINRRIAGMFVDATPAVIDAEPEVFAEDNMIAEQHDEIEDDISI